MKNAYEHLKDSATALGRLTRGLALSSVEFNRPNDATA